MSNLKVQKRIAASITGAGTSRVKILPDFADEVAESLTRSDIKSLIKDGKIIIERKKGISSGRKKLRSYKKHKKSEGKGYGSRKGRKGARREDEWVNKIRKIRRYLKWLRDNGIIDSHTYRKYYMKAKGGVFRSLADVRTTLKQQGLIKGDSQ
ncbi:50S ribosomal protein L19e [Sulfuracidifex metallicus]|uniref:Large ribosomal subunit protein eL19 n=1 Tax=Sulfuracidifex metallicus DSM 6482 = JCM 9184 TaxID=523847 RepID=A0A6A9QTS5_SULME|nr:50S ribosomal protein L19e [Sulfuracidifex metallicus]MUN28542.1 50S ribosomal protein L19e [Sulfuracidifex metallicus DSM 6482 = JCM 9184]WOE50920.1 50S ribosomal protein L19e [Sulfuracidifex metallicus DSM 6482 = JCM 9184]